MDADWQRTLSTPYGQGGEEQLARYEQALRLFRALYGPGEVALYRVPGRVNLIGEHTDYQQGYVLPVALDKDLLFLARPREDALVVLHNVESREFPLREFALSAEIAPAPAGDWSNYARGAAQMLCRVSGEPLRGAQLLVVGAPLQGVPRGAGLSSSSALTVGVAFVLADLNQLAIPRAELAWLCGEAEWYVGTRGGIMDQFIALLGQRNYALFLDCRPRRSLGSSPEYCVEQVPLPEGYTIIVADTKIRHHNVRSEFNVRVAEGRIGVALLKERLPAVTHLRDLERYEWAEIEPLLPEAITRQELAGRGVALEQLMDVALPGIEIFQVRKRCRHVVTENARVRQGVLALRAGDVQRFGALMNEAHASVRDDYGASCFELDCLVDLAREVEGVIGSRMTGAGWGGCTVTLARAGCEEEFVRHVSRGYREATGLWPEIFICRAGQGASFVGRAVLT